VHSGETGFVEGRNVAIEYRRAEGRRAVRRNDRLLMAGKAIVRLKITDKSMISLAGAALR
jgi:hypothetical protein